MKSIKLLLTFFCITLLYACAPKNNENNYLGHWVDKNSKTLISNASLDISKNTDDSFVVTLNRWSMDGKTISRWNSFSAAMKGGKLTAPGVIIFIKDDGALFFDKDYVR